MGTFVASFHYMKKGFMKMENLYSGSFLVQLPDPG